MGAQQSAIANLFSSEYHQIVMIGLDCAGKTTVLYKLKADQNVNTIPTLGFNCEKVKGFVGKSKGVSFTIWDIGGQDKIRPLWNTYMSNAEGIIFVIDSSDRERLEEVKLELSKTARNLETEGVPILIIANKQDLPGAKSCAELELTLSLNELDETHPWGIVPTVASQGQGVHEALNCLYEMMHKVKKLKRGRSKSSFH